MLLAAVLIGLEYELSADGRLNYRDDSDYGPQCCHFSLFQCRSLLEAQMDFLEFR